jgi:hypothetical protein
MGDLKLKAGIILALLMDSPVALRIMTGIAALVILVLAASLVMAFPEFFAAIFMLGVLVLVLYGLGNFIWDIIES